LASRLRSSRHHTTTTATRTSSCDAATAYTTVVSTLARMELAKAHDVEILGPPLAAGAQR
jgi:hypothetical protein